MVGLVSKTLNTGAFLAVVLSLVPGAVALGDDSAPGGIVVPGTITTTTQTTHIQSTTTIDNGDSGEITATLRPTLPPQMLPSPLKIKKDYWLAYRMANAEWLDKAAAANPRIVAAICSRPGPAKVLAQHRHIAAIADADHYLCRRLCQWKGATEKLIRNKHCDHVILLDPEGIYAAIDQHPSYARLIARDMEFQQTMMRNPDLGKVMSEHIR